MQERRGRYFKLQGSLLGDAPFDNLPSGSLPSTCCDALNEKALSSGTS